MSQWLELGAVLAVALLLAVGRRAWLRLVQAGTAPGGSQSAVNAT